MDEREMYYRNQLRGLYLILKDTDDIKDFMISREYVKEKINMILSGGGINFHPSIKNKLKEDC